MEGAPKLLLGVPAVRQVVCKMRKGEKEEMEMAAKLERSCTKFDRAKRGALTIDEYWNVCRVQNGIDITKDEVKAIMAGLPQDEDGRIKIDDFIKKDIHSSEAFQAIDRNNDGFISKGELKLAKKEVAIKDVEKCISNFDINHDGKLSLKEFKASGTSKHSETNKSRSGLKSVKKSSDKKKM